MRDERMLAHSGAGLRVEVADHAHRRLGLHQDGYPTLFKIHLIKADCVSIDQVREEADRVPRKVIDVLNRLERRKKSRQMGET
jgi:hypothetical protein